MITSEVNFLSFGRRKKILGRMHKKYSILIISILLFLVCLFINIQSDDVVASVQVYNNNVQEKFTHTNEYINDIIFLINEMKLYLQNISYRSNGIININVKIIDKKNIYDIIDTLDKNLFNVISYKCIAENVDEFVYEIQIGV